MFEDKPIVVRSHSKGYITDGRSFPPESVQDCLNMDFFKDRDEKRPAYTEKPLYVDGVLTSMNTILPSGYSIVGFREKLFVDEAGNSQVVILIVACHSSPSSSNPLKLYVNKFFNPANTFYNYTGAKTNQIGTTDWEENVTELTEKIAFTTPNATYSDSDRVNTTTVAGLAGEKDQYYHGWYVYDSSNDCVGCITSYTGASGLIVVRLNSYDNAGTITLRNMLAGNYVMYRYPVTKKFKTEFDSVVVTDATFSEKANTLQICLGKGIKLLNLTFLQEKRFFGEPATIIGSGVNALYKNWNGFWFTKDAPEITDKKTYVYLQQMVDGDYTGYVADEVEDLGIIINYGYNADGDSSSKHLTGGGLTATIDGYQAVFLKNWILEWSGAGVVLNWSYVSVYFMIDYDRRLSALSFFWGDQPAFTPKTPYNEEINDVYQMLPAYGGYVDIATEHVATLSTTHNFYETWVVWTDATSGNIPAGYRGGTDNNWTDLTSGNAQDAFLNNYYWKDIYTKAGSIIAVNDDVLAISLANDAVSTDSDYDKNGQLKGALSQIQQGIIDANSVFVDERVRQITQGQELVGGEGTVNQQFLLFTATNCLWYNIADTTSFLLQRFQDFQFRGAYSRQSIVKAQYGDQFAGIYWVSPSGSIYRFLDKYPEDLLFNYWRDEFQAISETDRAAAKMGFLPRTREVFVIIASTIYIWNIEYEHWKKYAYGDVPAYYSAAISGELNFSTARYLFGTENALSTVWKDKGSVNIPFSFKMVIDEGIKSENKIPDRIDINYNITPVLESGEPLQSQINVKVTADDKAAGSIMDTSFNLYVNGVSPKKKVLTCTKRARTNKFSVEVSSVAANEGNIKRFEINEFGVNAKIGNRFGDKI
jgi:hypothetical protein